MMFSPLFCFGFILCFTCSFLSVLAATSTAPVSPPPSLYSAEFVLSDYTFRGQDNLPFTNVASDPDIWDWGNGTLSMVFTCVDGDGFGGSGIALTALCVADATVPTNPLTPLEWIVRGTSTSSDTPGWMGGCVIHGSEGSWYESVETGGWIIAENGDLGIMFAGYEAQTWFNSSMGIAWSSDGGGTFVVDSMPVLQRIRGGYDSDDVYSPSIVRMDDGSYVGVYAGHCYFDCDPIGVHLIGITSLDAHSWSRTGIVLSVAVPSTFEMEDFGATPRWMSSGIAEPVLLRSPFPGDSSCDFIILFTGIGPDDDDYDRSIGMACSSQWDGPWKVRREPVVPDKPVLAPSSLVFRENVVNVFFLDISEDPYLFVGRIDAILGEAGLRALLGLSVLACVLFMLV